LIKTDKILEIGPGWTLTELLLEMPAKFWPSKRTPGWWNISGAVNVGQASRLSLFKRESETGATPVLRLLHADALELLKREPRDWRNWKLVANLPYSVASPILVELAQTTQRPERMSRRCNSKSPRLMAQAGDDDYGVLTLLVQLDTSRASVQDSGGCFSPLRMWIRRAWF